MYTKSELQRLYAKAKAARLFGGVAALITGVASTLLTMDGKEFTYNSPIHENDTLFGGFSYREIMDVVIANYGHNITEKQFDKAIEEFMDIRIEDMKENLMMCKANMLKEIRKAG